MEPALFTDPGARPEEAPASIMCGWPEGPVAPQMPQHMRSACKCGQVNGGSGLHPGGLAGCPTKGTQMKTQEIEEYRGLSEITDRKGRRGARIDKSGSNLIPAANLEIRKPVCLREGVAFVKPFDLASCNALIMQPVSKN